MGEHNRLARVKRELDVNTLVSRDHVVGQAARYVAVAGTGLVVALLIFALQIELGVNEYAAVLSTFVINGVFNFVGFRLWAFPRSGYRPVGEVGRFTTVAIGSLGINYSVFAVSFDVVGLSALPAQTVAIAVAAPIGFMANRLWTFKAGRVVEPARQSSR